MSTFKKKQAVKARTVLGTKFSAGVVTDVRTGPKGDWYSVKLADGSTINTRAACIKAA